jgi:hypothetical protein
LHPETINSWVELKKVFLKFWGKEKSLDQQLNEFYALKRHINEVISMFSKKFSSIYYNMSEEVQPSEAASMLHYATTLHPNFSFLRMERRPESLQQMFSDAQDIQHNIQACNLIQNEKLNSQEHERKCEQEIIDWNFEHIIDDIIDSHEASNGNNFANNCIPLVERRDVDLASDLSHDKRGTYNFMYLFVDSQEDEFAN